MINRDLRIAISAPINDNLYSLLVSQLCIKEVGIKIVGVITLKIWSIKRLIDESRRLGFMLIRKIWEKYFLGYSHEAVPQEWNVIKMENKHIEVYVLPQAGGKVWGVCSR